jgi:PASTA domain
MKHQRTFLLAARVGVVVTVAALIATSFAAGAHAADPPPSAPVDAGSANPFAPSYQHSYRHGAVPTIGAKSRMDAFRAQHPGALAASASPLQFGGGSAGIGVTTGAPRVYLVFWGSTWGNAGTDGNGDLTLSGDTSSGAPRLQEMFKGLGTGGELWSGVMTQYCDSVPAGTTTCAPTTTHVGYPSGGALAGVLYDNSTEPTNATQTQLATEAVSAAGRFGNTTPAANRNAQYVILSAPGYHPDGFGPTSSFCAWHSGVFSSVTGPIAYTNMPYVMDVGSSCGQNYVNSGTAGTLDGYTIVEGHEYAETITDQLPRGGWADPSGDENADKCAWIGTSPNTHGGAANIATGRGSFAEQGTWSNDSNATGGQCEISHMVLPAFTVVPDLSGDTPSAAGQALAAAGLVRGSVGSAVDNSCNNIGTVMNQSPAAGTTVLVGTAVNMTIGTKPRPPKQCP